MFPPIFCTPSLESEILCANPEVDRFLSIQLTAVKGAPCNLNWNIGVIMLKSVRQLVGLTSLLFATIGMAHAIPTDTFVAPNPDMRCFSNAFTPEIQETVSERVMVHPGYEKIRHIPAVYHQRRLRVVVKDPMLAYQATAPSYTLRYEDILVTPAQEISVNIPAKYETWTEIVEIEPAKTVWKRGKALYGHEIVHPVTNIADHDAGASVDILCKIEIPARKRIVHHTRMVSPPRKEVQSVPARYKRVARQVVHRPAFAKKIAVSAEYAAVPYEKQIRAARQEIKTIPATYEDVERQRVKMASQLIRVEALCDQFASRDTVRELQTALVDRGYHIKVDGIYGPETQGAMEQFQRDNALSRGYMTLESVQALQVTPSACMPLNCEGARAQTTVLAAQGALSAAGYYASRDGLHGPQTQVAMERFQAANDLEVGFLSAETMRALNIIDRI